VKRREIEIKDRRVPFSIFIGSSRRLLQVCTGVVSVLQLLIQMEWETFIVGILE
jgi:hypothetical protein